MGLFTCFKWTSCGSRAEDHFSVLPTEILEKIFSHLRPKHLIANVAPVCRRFHYVLKNERWWNSKILKHPLNIWLCDATKNSEGYSAMRTYDAILSNEKLRNDWEAQERYIMDTGDECVDAVRLFRKGNEYFCLAAEGVLDSGWNNEPNQAIKLWSMDTLTKAHHKGKAALPIGGTVLAHEKMITGLELYRDADQFLTSSYFDGTVRLWDMGNGGITHVHMKTYGKSINSISVQDRMVACNTGLIALSSFTAAEEPSVFLLDAGNGFQEIARAQYPSFTDNTFATSVLKGNILYILFSESLVTVDIRNVHAPIHVQKSKSGWSSTISYADGHIYCLERDQELNVFDAPDLSPCYSFNVCPNMNKHNGYRTLTKTRGSILVHEPYKIKAFSLGPRPVLLGSITTWDNHSMGKPMLMALDSLDQYIVAGGSNGKLITWMDSDN